MIYKAPTSIKNQGAQKASTLLQKINTIAVTLRPLASIGQLMTAPKRAAVKAGHRKRRQHSTVT